MSNNQQNKQDQKVIPLWLTWTVTTASLLCAGLYLFRLSPFATDPTRFDKRLMALLIIAILPWFLNGFLRNVTRFKFGDFEIEQRLKRQDSKIEQQQELIRRMFLSSMDKDVLDTLQNLLRTDFIHKKEDLGYAPVMQQLRHLNYLNYLDTPPEDLPDGDIGHGRHLTRLGRQFIEEREKLERIAKEDPNANDS